MPRRCCGAVGVGRAVAAGKARGKARAAARASPAKEARELPKAGQVGARNADKSLNFPFALPFWAFECMTRTYVLRSARDFTRSSQWSCRRASRILGSELPFCGTVSGKGKSKGKGSKAGKVSRSASACRGSMMRLRRARAKASRRVRGRARASTLEHCSLPKLHILS